MSARQQPSPLKFGGLRSVSTRPVAAHRPQPETSFVGALALPEKEALAHANNTMPKVAILLCTCNGQQYLVDQLDSLKAQSHSNWEVWASDDGSTDDTQAILETHRQKWPAGRLFLNFGPAKGFAANFLSLTCKSSIEANYYAYCDQDDIWEVDKLERAVRWLETIPPNIPALYCARTRLVDAENNDIGLSPLFLKPPSFANALIQNIGGGNTMVFNKSARTLLQEGGGDIDVISHDWWTYMLVAGCGGQVFYDVDPTVRYRQHKNNLVGANTSWSARIVRAKKLLKGQFRYWNDVNIRALQKMYGNLTPEARSILGAFDQARKSALTLRMTRLYRSGAYRQTLLGNLGLTVAALLRKL
jgi:glycosyltransferase involved in cell wall biosynthesis